MFKKAAARKVMMALLIAIALSAVAGLVYAANPIITHRFSADPAPYDFNGRVYLYVTDDSDNSGTTWDSKNWRAYSSTDLVNWTDHGSIFKVGSGGFAWASNYAWAPSAAYRNGYYYLYLPVDALNSNSISKVGVARSTSPASGFVDAIGGPLLQEGREPNVGTEAIDPQVFIDDDGQAYLYFGGLRVLKVVKLNADMISLNGPIQNVSMPSSFAEGSWMHKRNGIYYMSYSTGWPGPIRYATGTSPLGPFTERGTILASQNTNTNHQGILNYNNQWFLFYQRGALPGWNNYRRSVQIDCMYYSGDNIQQVTTTTGGVTSTSCSGTAPASYRLTNRASGKVADVNGASMDNNAKVIQWSWHGGNNQLWQFVDRGSGYYNLVNRNSGKCLDVTGVSSADGALIIQYTCGNGNNQQFQWVAVGSYYQLIARHSGKCISIVGNSTADGTQLEQRTCSSTNNSMQWTRQ